MHITQLAFHLLFKMGSPMSNQLFFLDNIVENDDDNMDLFMQRDAAIKSYKNVDFVFKLRGKIWF